MLPLVYPRRWLIAGLVLLVSVLAFALVPALWLWPGGPGGFWHMPDKWLHGMTFLLLALWFSGQYARHAYWKLASGLLIFGALIEACQYLVPYRSAQFGDMLADVAGIACGVVLALLGAGGWSMRAESWLREKIE